MAAAEKKKSHNKGLGRGLDALLGDLPSARPVQIDGDGKRELPIEFLTPNASQPRRIFDKTAIEELAASIKARGLLQPILVRPMGADRYEIVAGERRWRAAQKAHLHNVAVIIRDLTDEQAAEIALIENVQRVDLNPVEEARAYNRLADSFGRTQEQISKAVGKSRSHVANMMRLSNLPKKALSALNEGVITMGHARALLGSSDPDRVCARVIKEHLSVRETERLAKDFGETRDGSGKPSKNRSKTMGSLAQKDADTRAVERDLAAILGLEVSIDRKSKDAGVVTLKYMTLDQLDDICRRLMGARV